MNTFSVFLLKRQGHFLVNAKKSALCNYDIVEAGAREGERGKEGGRRRTVSLGKVGKSTLRHILLLKMQVKCFKSKETNHCICDYYLRWRNLTQLS